MNGPLKMPIGGRLKPGKSRFILCSAVCHFLSFYIPVISRRVLRFFAPPPNLLNFLSANMNVEENELETNAIIESNGRVMLFRSLITDITCHLDLTYFPFDQARVYILTFFKSLQYK